MIYNYLCVFLLVLVFNFSVRAYPEPGKWTHTITGKQDVVAISKTLFKGSKIMVSITDSKCNPGGKVSVDWSLTEFLCWKGNISTNELGQLKQPGEYVKNNDNETFSSYVRPTLFDCPGPIALPTMVLQGGKDPPNGEESNAHTSPVRPHISTDVANNRSHASEVAVITEDGLYLLTIMIKPAPDMSFETKVIVEIKNDDYGYLSASDWPLLPFYGIMCLVYIVMGLAWLIASFCRWRDLLRIQFWIGGVILLGMLEKATFYAEYESINRTGLTSSNAVLAAEWVSCAKRTLARMLVIIVNLGFGIVKPRLGPMLNKVVGVGACYFILACVESYIRILPRTPENAQKLMLAAIPLAALDSIICWWILTALVQTTRTLRLRRNMVKLSLYRHFTNTLIFNVLASVIFMLYTIKAHKFTDCLRDWKELWVDDAFWHILFSIILLVIMVLWRPTNNNQRYAFSPLLDNPDDDDEEDQFVNDAYGIKMRSHSRASSPKLRQSNEDEDILKWVDDNIPSAGVEAALPILDSDEEVVTTRFEVSKML